MSAKLVPCPACEGSGEIECESCHGWGACRIDKAPCSECIGEGTLPCPLCVGEGIVTAACARGYRDGLEAGRVKG